MIDNELLLFCVGLAIILVLTLVLVSIPFILRSVLHKVGKKDKEQLSTYECGFQSFSNVNTDKFYIHFFLLSVLFLIFDLEILYLLPMVNLSVLSLTDYLVCIIFFLILTAGYVIDYMFGALKFILNK